MKHFSAVLNLAERRFGVRKALHMIPSVGFTTRPPSLRELICLKHITGFSALFKNREYSHASVSQNQVEIRKRYQEKQAESVT